MTSWLSLLRILLLFILCACGREKVLEYHTIEKTVHDTVWVTESDTVFMVQRDTMWSVAENTVRDTIEVIAQSFRPDVRDSWSEVVEEITPAVYWLGVTAQSQGTTRYEVTFLGTGFAVHEYFIVTNYHVGQAMQQQMSLVRDDLEPIAIAIRAGTRIWEDGTFVLGGTEAPHGELWGYWDVRYDGTPSSPDLVLLPVRGLLVQSLPFLPLAPLDDLFDLEVGDEIGILGFPGILETNQNPYTLSPNPTFKSGTISALRPYRTHGPFSSENRGHRALMGKVIQHNLGAAPGNSGSPIFNKRGEVVAIHNAGIESSGDAFDFAIRADEIRLLLKSMWAGQQRPPNAKTVAFLR